VTEKVNAANLSL